MRAIHISTLAEVLRDADQDTRRQLSELMTDRETEFVICHNVDDPRLSSANNTLDVEMLYPHVIDYQSFENMTSKTDTGLIDYTRQMFETVAPLTCFTSTPSLGVILNSIEVGKYNFIISRDRSSWDLLEQIRRYSPDSNMIDFECLDIGTGTYGLMQEAIDKMRFETPERAKVVAIITSRPIALGYTSREEDPGQCIGVTYSTRYAVGIIAMTSFNKPFNPREGYSLTAIRCKRMAYGAVETVHQNDAVFTITPTEKQPLWLTMNEDRTIGVVTNDKQVAYEARKGADSNCSDANGKQIRTAVGFTEDTGDENAYRYQIQSITLIEK